MKNIIKESGDYVTYAPINTPEPVFHGFCFGRLIVLHKNLLLFVKFILTFAEVCDII